jgi:radical SAM protein with 4Fe4S-binding SPASM domain
MPEEKDYLTKLVIELNDSIAQQGKYLKDRSLPALALNHCMADKDGSVIIQPGGQLTKCEHSSALENFGTIDSPQWDMDNIAAWKTHAELPPCQECPLYPSCIWPTKCPSTGECQGAMQQKKIQDTLEAMEQAVKEAKKAKETKEIPDSQGEGQEEGNQQEPKAETETEQETE